MQINVNVRSSSQGSVHLWFGISSILLYILCIFTYLFVWFAYLIFIFKIVQYCKLVQTFASFRSQLFITCLFTANQCERSQPFAVHCHYQFVFSLIFINLQNPKLNCFLYFTAFQKQQNHKNTFIFYSFSFAHQDHKPRCSHCLSAPSAVVYYGFNW